MAPMLKPRAERLAKGLWWDRSWNLVGGCTPVDESCANCWGARVAYRLGHNPNPNVRAAYEGLTDAGGHWTGEVRFRRELLDLPLRTRKPTVWAVWMDLFHPAVSVVDCIAHAFLVMSLAPKHLFLVLTKRPGRMEQLLRGEDDDYDSELDVAITEVGDCSANPDSDYGASWLPTWALDELRHRAHHTTPRGLSWPLPNVWLGTTVATQSQADQRIPELLRCPAALHFVSCEPLLGAVNLSRSLVSRCMVCDEDTDDCPCGGEEMAAFLDIVPEDGHWMDILPAEPWEDTYGDRLEATLNELVARTTRGRLGLVIAGGESGPDARPTHPDWVRSLRDQCQGAQVPFFFKQSGAWSGAGGQPNHLPHRALHWDGRSVVYDAEDQRTKPWRHVFAPDEGDMIAFLARVGKTRAGHLLDGREWLQWPGDEEIGVSGGCT